jgi:hypothetical protein
MRLCPPGSAIAKQVDSGNAIVAALASACSLLASYHRNFRRRFVEGLPGFGCSRTVEC